MKKIIEKFKPTLKVIGIIIGIIALWIIFGIITGNKTSDNQFKKTSSLGSPMIQNRGMDLQEDIMEAGMMQAENTAFSQEAIESETSATIPPIEKKVIKNGDLNLKIENTEKAAAEISLITKNQTGEVFSTNFYERVKGQKSGNITIKVPIEKFEVTLTQIKTIATQVISESTTGQDVTERYTDLQAQLKNKQAEEQSFVKILDRTGDIEDVLAVTKQIARVRGEIERLEGQIKFMNSQTNMSTITINLSEDIEITPIQNDWRPWQVIKKSFSDLLNNSQDFVDGIIRFIIVGIPSLIPFLLFLGIIYWIGKKLWRKIKS